MADRTFSLFRNEVVRSLNKFGVSYKIFGGAAVQLIESSRATTDIDMFIKQTHSNIDNLVKALADCKFGDYQYLWTQINEGVAGGYKAFQLFSNNPRWEDFWIDVVFELGQYDYETVTGDIHETATGLSINIVALRYIAYMKANIYPKPRPKDVDDIILIADHLGLDPETGEPLSESNKKKRRGRHDS